MQPESYRRIAATIELPAATVIFLSDVAAELDAAAEAGMQTVQLVRDDKVVRGAHEIAENFDDVQSILSQIFKR
jgi:enolase-phosphatase E1